MTRSLCFQCGETKFGALVPCPECQAGSTGNPQLDIAFSDHLMSVSTLEAFGRVVRAIREVCEHDQLRFWSFIRFVSVHHSDILGMELPPEMAIECDEVLASARPPAVTVEESPAAGMKRSMRGREHPDHPDQPEPGS